MTRFSLRQLIFLSYILLIIPIIVLFVLFMQTLVVATVDDAFNAAYERDTILMEDVLLGMIDELGTEAIRESADLSDFQQFANDIEITVMLLDVEGKTVFFDSREGRVERSAEPRPDIQSILLDEEEFPFDENGVLFTSLFAYGSAEQPQMILRVGRSNETALRTRQTRNRLLMSSAVIVGSAVLIVLGSWMANRLTEPLLQLRHTANAMAAGALGTRADTHAPVEVAALAHDFNEMADAIEGMVKEQRAFASNAAHELRTPLTAMRLRTGALLEDEISAEVTHEYVLEIDQEMRRLSNLVEDLHLLARVDTDNLQVARQSVDCGRIIRALEAEFATQMRQKRFTWCADLPERLPAVLAGINHIQVVLRNLIENAIKYTPDGGKIEIKASATETEVEIVIQDNGVGISAEDLPHIFKRFYRADKSRSRNVAGVGLGLSMARSIVALYNGTIVVESEGLGNGTTITLRLPL